MKLYAHKEFQMYCFNATDNKLINIALEKMQDAEYKEDGDFHRECAHIAMEEMDRRGLDVKSLLGADEDLDADMDM